MRGQVTRGAARHSSSAGDAAARGRGVGQVVVAGVADDEQVPDGDV